MLTIPQCDPRANYLVRQIEIDQAIKTVLKSGRYLMGGEVSAFEEEFANYIGVTYAVAVASGTDALHLALRACGIGAGDFVITVSHTAVATVKAIELAGATPVLVDVDSETLTLDPALFEQAIQFLPGEGNKAVIPVHLYGQPANLFAIKEIANRYGLKIIEDCAQSHGAMIDGQRTGSFGDLAAFSFYPTKNLGAIGDGGMVVTSDEELAGRVRLAREYGWRERYISYSWGINSRLDELQAAILRVKLKYLDETNRQRQLIAEMYDQALGKTDLQVPCIPPQTTHVYHQYVVRTESRDSLQCYLAENGIGTLIHYPVPVHQQPAYAGKVLCPAPLTRTEAIAGQILSLPMYPELTNAQVGKVCENVLAWMSTG